MSEKTELNIDLQGMTPVTEHRGGPIPIAGAQINRSRKGSKLSSEEKAKKTAKREQVRKAKAKKLAIRDAKQQKNDSILIPDSESMANVRLIEEEEGEWDEIVIAPPPITDIEENLDEYVPEPPKIQNIPRNNKLSEDIYGDLEEKVIIKPLPPIGLAITNPIILNGMEPYDAVERLYGDIGYFILSEQMIPRVEPAIKLLQLKLDDGRPVNLFMQI